ncbi:MAG TPA: CHAT domain-containing protein [Candidatus Angelobacter sp.]|nr:CHAT domain-containing protein [Candidatus Angelobacter sp.]
MNPIPHRQCPDDEILQEVAAGISSPELAEQTMRHVARCSICGPALRRYVREFSAEESPDNTQILEQLETSKPAGQRRLVQKLARRPRRALWMMIVPAVSALAVALLAVIEGPSFMADLSVRKAQSQAAAAFADRRTTEMRLASVPYSPYKPFPAEMGGKSSRDLDEIPPELTSASGAANESLTKEKEKVDPRWLQVQGRALLWASTPASLEKAEKDFEKARASGLDTPSLDIDLAASYFERDSRAEHPNLQRSLNLLNDVLNKPKLSDEDRASALYNLAIAYEKTQAWDLAAATWEKYLEVDRSSGWRKDAQEHLGKAKDKIRGPGQSKLISPGAFLQGVQGSAIQVEDYQDVAVSAWLVDAVGRRDDESLKAAQALAELLKQKHSDPWLADMVASLHAQDLPGLKSLAAAMEKNSQGNHGEALKEALAAAQIFKSHGNRSGEFRARIEEVNAARRMLNGSECLARAGPVGSQLAHTSYQWFKARLSLEIAECGNLLGTFAESDAHLATSREIARQFDYPVLELRDIGISAGNKHLRGDCNESWRESVDGLGVYWQKSQSTPGPLFQFYSVMSQCAMETGSLYAGEAFLRHAIDVRKRFAEQNRTIEGMMRMRLANVLSARKADDEAAQEKKQGVALIDRRLLPKRFDLTLELEQAEFQLDHGDANRALITLEPVRTALADKPDSFFVLSFNQTSGNAFLKLGRLNEAGEAYERAIQTAESALDDIKDWRERLQWLRATDESYRGLVRVLIEQKRPEEALERWELYRSRALVQARQQGVGERSDTPKLTQTALHTTQQSSSNPAPRLVYAHFNDGIHIWLLQNRSVSSYWVKVDKEEVESTIREFVEKCATETSKLDEVQQLGLKLFSFMVQPVVNDLVPAGSVVIELDQGAYNLPMEALRTPEGHYLGEKYSLVYSPGAWMEKALRVPEPLSGRESFSLIDASHAPDAGYLPGLDGQREAIARLFPHARVLDSAKVPWTQAETWLATSDVIHYMGHGTPDGSGTKLDYAADHPLRVRDFSPVVLRRAQIVLLAACSGAAGRENGFADTDNLVHAVLSAGVPVVIASHWNVDSRYTSRLVIAFYQHLRNNQTVDLAMYNARVEIMRDNPHPYFWAGFALNGRLN